jgi:hypothetical protein
MFMVGESDKHPRTLKDGVYVTLTCQQTYAAIPPSRYATLFMGSATEENAGSRGNTK